MNFGDAKGLAFERVLIYPTKPMLKWRIIAKKCNLKADQGSTPQLHAQDIALELYLTTKRILQLMEFKNVDHDRA